MKEKKEIKKKENNLREGCKWKIENIKKKDEIKQKKINESKEWKKKRKQKLI